jgi:DNA-binding transcriptional LysR family regulator
VRLLDRSPRGVEPTTYGRVLLKGGTAAFDELKQSIREIEFLSDPSTGEVRIGCVESIASSILPPIIQGFFQQYPRVALHVHRLSSPALELPELRGRSLDLVLARIMRPLVNEVDELTVEVLFEDEMVVVAGMASRWARLDKIDLAEMVNEPWVLTPPDSWTNMMVAEAFHARGLDMPRICLTTFSGPLRTNLVAAGPFITALPSSILRLDSNRALLKTLPIDLPVRPWPVAIVTLKNRALSPIVARFTDHVRAFTRSMGGGLTPAKQPA